jgi:DNA-binding transcriptional LysR family regulator
MDRLSAMEVFARVVESGSFAGAAARLGLSRAAASKHVMQLEEHLGVRLLNRTTRRLSLTAEGAAFHERCQRILAELEQAECEASEARGEPRGTLRISAPVSFGTRHLGGAIGEFSRQYPRVSIALTLDDRFVDLVEDGFDAAIRIGRLPDSTLVARRLCAARLVIVAAPAYWARAGRPRALEDLAGHSALNYTLRAAGRDWRFGEGAGERSVAVSGPISANNGDVLRAAAVAGAGAALLPDFIVGEDVKAGRLEPVLQSLTGPAIGIHVVYPQTRHVTAKLRLFVDFLVGHFGTPPAWQL